MAELDNIASQLLKSASEADKIYSKTRDQSEKDKATRLRVIVQNLKTLTLGASDLNGLSDVTLTSPTNAQLLVYNSSTGQWVNQYPAVVSTPTLAQVTTAGNTTTNAITVGGLTVGQVGGSGTINFPTTISGFAASIFTQYASNNLNLRISNTYVKVYGSGQIELTGSTTITGITGAAALVVQQGNAAWSPVADFNGSAGTALRVNTNGNILIGTTTDAGYKLDVNGTSRFTQAVVVNAGGVKTESGTITSQTGVNSGRMTMFNLRNTGGGYQSAVGTSLAIAFTNRETGAVWSDDVIENVVYSNTAGAVTTGYSFYTHSNQTYNASPVLAMSINGLNVGIGTATPSYPFHISSAAAANIYGTVQSTNANGTAAWVAFNDQSDNVVYRVFGSGASGTQMGIALARSASLIANLGGAGSFLLGTYSATNFIMGTGNAEKMRIVDSTGNILIATTTDLGNKLEVNGNLNSTGYKINNTAGYTGTLVIVTNPPGQQNIDIRGGIIVNVF